MLGDRFFFEKSPCKARLSHSPFAYRKRGSAQPPSPAALATFYRAFGIPPTALRAPPASSRAMALLRNRKFADSPLEGNGSELPVPQQGELDPRSSPRSKRTGSGGRCRKSQAPSNGSPLKKRAEPQLVDRCADPSEAIGARKRGDNQLHRFRVLEVRIHSSPAGSHVPTWCRCTRATPQRPASPTMSDISISFPAWRSRLRLGYGRHPPTSQNS